MVDSLEQLRTALKIEPGREVKPENHLIDDLGVERDRVLELINTRFPLLLGVSHDVAERSRFFSAVMDLPIEGSVGPWTVQRLMTIFQKCAECAYPDNGSS